MPTIHGRDLDLNLLKVFAAVVEHGGVTAAAGRLYLTQPAVSAALRRLTTAVGAPLFARQGRGLVLTARGQRLRAAVHPHLQLLIDAALAPPTFDPRTSARTVRLGLSDAAEVWLLPPLVRRLGRDAPHLRVVAAPVQFRTVGAALAAGIDAAVTVADELPATIRRQPLHHGGFVCLFDPRHVRVRRLTEAAYFAHDHVIVSYNGDLRGIVEDTTGKARRIRCAVASFASIGPLVDGAALLATVPDLVAAQIRATRPHLRTAPVPLALTGSPIELLWPAATDDDEVGRLVRALIAEIAASLPPGPAKRRPAA